MKFDFLLHIVHADKSSEWQIVISGHGVRITAKAAKVFIKDARLRNEPLLDATLGNGITYSYYEHRI